ncbi:MAG TPA: membrane lipoprotein lipid attachment site-containing protein [Rhizobium sp.]|nr:membrane lipoprotein lipid attachment site-containing protein [Rhizobium sp.]
MKKTIVLAFGLAFLAACSDENKQSTTTEQAPATEQTTPATPAAPAAPADQTTTPPPSTGTDGQTQGQPTPSK